MCVCVCVCVCVYVGGGEGRGGGNYKIEKQNKQIKTFQVVLLTRPGVCGGRGGGGRTAGPIPSITYPCVV